MLCAIKTTLPHTSVVSLAKDFTTNSGKRLATAFAICFISGVFCGTVSTLMSVYLPVAVKDLQGSVSDEELTRIGATINSLFIFGWMFGGITWGFIGDR
ncbi:MAG: hypothetical protein H7Y01_07595, partial [Ferruginibacter sp.]|nr:hypothetical protein [Chitinophagaceae bacterium]